jgi:hypothetical protein
MAVFARACVRFFAHLAHRLAGDRRRKAERHDFVSQEPQGPVGLSCWGRSARHRAQVRFMLPCPCPLGARPRCLIERSQMRLDKPLARARHRGSAHIQRRCNGVIAPPVRSCEQNPHARQFACACRATPEHVF